MTLADRIVVLDAGVVQQVGTPLELYHRPKNIFVAGFIGSPKMNFLPCTIVGSDGGKMRVAADIFGEVSVPSIPAVKVEPGTLATLGIRPENFVIEVDPNGGAFVVNLVEQLGDETLVEVEAGPDTQFVVKAGPMAGIRAGDRIGLSFAAGGVHLFDAQGLAYPSAVS
jgi:ABC-type sugar transport system ATPase subunit